MEESPESIMQWNPLKQRSTGNTMILSLICYLSLEQLTVVPTAVLHCLCGGRDRAEQFHMPALCKAADRWTKHSR